MGAFMALLGLVDPVSKIVSKIIDLQTKKLDAATEQERIAINEEIEALKARRDVMIAEAGSRINPWMRAFIAIGPAAFLFKVFLLDKVVGPFIGCVGDTRAKAWCDPFTTDKLDDNLWLVVMSVIGFYLVTTVRLFKK